MQIRRRTQIRLIVFTVTAMLILIVGLQLKQNAATQDVFSQTEIRYGASGNDVYELQGRLKQLGFFYGDVDGEYGWKTLKSVKWFQSEFGLNVDGVIGAKTKSKLWEETKSWAPTEPRKTNSTSGGNTGKAVKNPNKGVSPSSQLGLTENDIKLMSNAVYGEARGEPYIGQVAVAAVILNRVRHTSFPKTVSGVIFQPGAFTAVADGQIWLTPNAKARNAVVDAINGMDPSGGCIYYFNPVTATSKWIWSRPQIKTIGKHIFAM